MTWRMSQRFLVLEWSLLRGMWWQWFSCCDVLRPLNFLSLYLQDPHIRFTLVDNRVIATINKLTELIPLLKNLDRTTYFFKVTDFFEDISDRVEVQRRMWNQRDVNPAEFFRTVGVPFIYSVIGEVSHAFITSPVLNSFLPLDQETCQTRCIN